jgi:hypothetical protein
VPPAPKSLLAKEQSLNWTPSEGAFWYRIYRSDRPEFAAGPDTFLTYVAQDTTSFLDNRLNLAGQKLFGAWYYRVSAVDKEDRESAPTKPMEIIFK